MTSSVPFCTSRSNTSSNNFSWTAGGKSSISAEKHGKDRFSCSLKPNSRQGRGQHKCYSNDTQRGCSSLDGILSMAHCKYKLCVLNCAHTKPEHWWLFSGSIVNGTGFVCEQERHKQTKRESECPAAGLGPNSLCSEMLGVRRTHTKILIYMRRLHNLCSHGQQQD